MDILKENHWFTIEKIDEKTFAISEYGHCEKMHSYLLLGETHGLLIDTGLGIGNIKKEIDQLTDLPIKVVTTHVHWDHIGGHRYFDDISVHKEEVDWLEHGMPIPLPMIKEEVMKEVFSETPPKDFNIEDYKVYTGIPKRVLKDLDTIEIGNRRVKVLHTPGHSPGHICLLEEKTGYLFTGDLIYGGTLYAFFPSTEPELYKKSIERINKIEGIKRLLPGHNQIDLPLDIIGRMKEAFIELEGKSLLKHGSGRFQFDDFSILL